MFLSALVSVAVSVTAVVTVTASVGVSLSREREGVYVGGVGATVRTTLTR